MSTIQTVNRGTVANDGTGDPLRTGAAKINANFTALNTEKSEISQQIGAAVLHKVMERKNSAGVVVLAVYVDEATDTTELHNERGKFATLDGDLLTLEAGKWVRAPSAPINASDLTRKGYVDALVPEDIDAVNNQKMLRRTITLGEIMTLNSSPYEILPQVAASAYAPYRIMLKINFGTTPWATAGSNLEIMDGSGNVYFTIPFAWLESAATQIYFAVDVEWHLPEFDTGLYLTAGAGDPTSGDSEIEMFMYYHDII